MISVITPVYNGEKFIEDCIKVVIDQACPDVEHIIMDGGSTDQTVEIIKRYAEQYPHIRWVSEKDKGQSDAMNKGIAIAKGEIIAILNADDFYEPNVLNRVTELFKNLPEPSFLVGNYNVINDEGKVVHVQTPGNLSMTYLLSRKAPFPGNPSAYFYHKSLHNKTGMYDIFDHYAMDQLFVLKAIQEASVVKYVDEIWGNYREIKGTKTVSSKESGQFLYNIQNALKRHRQQLPVFQRLKIDIESFYLFTVKYNLAKIKPLKKIWDSLKS